MSSHLTVTKLRTRYVYTTTRAQTMTTPKKVVTAFGGCRPFLIDFYDNVYLLGHMLRNVTFNLRPCKSVVLEATKLIFKRRRFWGNSSRRCITIRILGSLALTTIEWELEVFALRKHDQLRCNARVCLPLG